MTHKRHVNSDQKPLETNITKNDANTNKNDANTIKNDTTPNNNEGLTTLPLNNDPSQEKKDSYSESGSSSSDDGMEIAVEESGTAETESPSGSYASGESDSEQ